MLCTRTRLPAERPAGSCAGRGRRFHPGSSPKRKPSSCGRTSRTTTSTPCSASVATIRSAVSPSFTASATSTITSDSPGSASTRSAGERSASARSFFRARMLFTFTRPPRSGCSSCGRACFHPGTSPYIVTLGPGRISFTFTSTPYCASASSMSRPVCSCSSFRATGGTGSASSASGGSGAGLGAGAAPAIAGAGAAAGSSSSASASSSSMSAAQKAPSSSA